MNVLSAGLFDERYSSHVLTFDWASLYQKALFTRWQAELAYYGSWGGGTHTAGATVSRAALETPANQ